jgi:putative Mg2+ transporter-C (MgtC) family protein
VPVRVVSYVVSGIGFLGAGVIMRDQGNVRGLNTAATLWGSAAVGACAGADLILEAVLGTAFVLMANTLLRPIVNRIERQPLNVLAVETTNTVYVIANRSEHKQALALLEQALAAANYAPRDIETHAFGTSEVEIAATLTATSVDGGELEELVSQLATAPMINQAFWSHSTTE